MKLTITINMRDGGEPTASAQVIDIPANEVWIGDNPVRTNVRGALPKPRRSWKLAALDFAVFSGVFAGLVWLLS